MLHSFLIIIALALPANAQTAQAYFSQGVRAGNSGNFQAAVQAFTAAINADRNYVDAYYWRAQAEMELNRLDEALTDLTYCIRTKPTMTGCIYNRALLHFKRGNPVASLTDADALIAVVHLIENRNPLAFVIRGAALLQMGNARDAEFEFQFAQVEAYRFRNQLDRSVEKTNQYIQQMKRDARPVGFRAPAPSAQPLQEGKRLLDRRDSRGAVYQFDEVLRRDPKNVEALFFRGLAYHRLFQFSRSMDDLLNATTTSYGAAAWRYIGLNLFMLGRDDQSLQAYTSALELNPQYPEAFVNRAQLQIAMKPPRREDSVRDWSSALKLAPNNAKLLNGRAMAYHSLGLYSQAITDLNAAIQAAPKTAMPYCNMAVVVRDAGRKDQEQSWLSRCFALDPSEKQWFEKQKQWADAYEQWQRELAAIMASLGSGGNSGSNCAGFSGDGNTACMKGDMVSADKYDRRDNPR